jgi:hypothetical protein
MISTGGIEVLRSLAQSGVELLYDCWRVYIQWRLQELLDPARLAHHETRSTEADEGRREAEGTDGEEQ